MGRVKDSEIERLGQQQQRWAAVGVEADAATLDALDRLQRGLDFEQLQQQLQQQRQQDAARASSKTTRRSQAEAEAARVAPLFAAAYRPGMGRVKLQAGAAQVLREAERREQDRLATMQQAGNRHGARQASAALVALQQQSALLTVSRAGKWLQSHHPPTISERQ